MATPTLTKAEAVDRLSQFVHEKSVNFGAMYSSVLGGIVTDPEMMILPMDDHMVHRGHAVFDTAAIVNGQLYQLDPHMERFLRSAEMARIPLPYEPPEMRQIIIDTATASNWRDASVRYWLSPGQGGYGLPPTECIGSSFYVMIFRGQASPEAYYTEGMKLVTSNIAIKPPYFARVKSNNYLPNALVILDAKDHGADNGIFIDERGFVGESSNMNVAFVTPNRVFRHPKFDSILTGITIQRTLELAQQLVDQGDLAGIVIDDISVEEGKAAAEMMLVGSAIKVAPVVQWDGQPIGDGRPGPIAKKLFDMLQADKLSGEGQLIPLTYPAS